MTIDDLKLNCAGLAPKALCGGDVDELFEFMTRCTAFFEMVEGRKPGRGDAALLLVERPDAVAPEHKLLVGLRTPQGLAGVLDLLLGYPDDKTWYIGLLILDPNKRGAGLGAAVYSATQQWAAQRGARRIQLIVQEQNPSALKFWQAMGFREIGRAVQQAGAQLNHVVGMAHDF
jgi:ribosomal protein S18 acetylase RimI-like enzyme